MPGKEATFSGKSSATPKGWEVEVVVFSIKRATCSSYSSSTHSLSSGAQEAAAAAGAGELSIPSIGRAPRSPLPKPLWLLSLATALLSFGFISLLPVLSLFVSPVSPASPLGAFHEFMPQMAPVKDLIVRGFFSQRLQGLPLRSSARRFALMFPVLALGPSRCAAAAFAPAAPDLVGFGSCERSIVPSGLRSISGSFRHSVCRLQSSRRVAILTVSASSLVLAGLALV